MSSFCNSSIETATCWRMVAGKTEFVGLHPEHHELLARKGWQPDAMSISGGSEVPAREQARPRALQRPRQRGLTAEQDEPASAAEMILRSIPNLPERWRHFDLFLR